MLTFQQIGDEAASQANDSSSATRIVIDRAINQGTLRFGSILNREVRVEERAFSTVADQQYYQMPEYGVKIKSIGITIGGVAYDLDECADEAEWNRINQYKQTERSDIPELWHAKGQDMYGIYPIPSTSNTNAGLISFEPRSKRMSVADYTTGTITVTNNSATVTGSGTTFTALMVGRTLLVEDAGDNDGIPYKIAAYVSATEITLENYYGGLTGSGKSYRIGEVPDIPDEFHESLVDYALYRVYKRRRDRALAKDCKEAFDEAIILCRDNYSSMSSSQYVRRSRVGSRANYMHSRRDYMVTGS